MSTKDHLSNTVGARLRLSEKGISAEVKSRAVAALDRLLGSLIDIPTAKLETMAARKRVQNIRVGRPQYLGHFATNPGDPNDRKLDLGFRLGQQQC